MNCVPRTRTSLLRLIEKPLRATHGNVACTVCTYDLCGEKTVIEGGHKHNTQHEMWFHGWYLVVLCVCVRGLARMVRMEVFLPLKLGVISQLRYNSSLNAAVAVEADGEKTQQPGWSEREI